MMITLENVLFFLLLLLVFFLGGLVGDTTAPSNKERDALCRALVAACSADTVRVVYEHEYCRAALTAKAGAP